MREKGQPKVPGSGRKKGTPNKTTAEIKNMLQAVIEGRIEEELENDLDKMEAYKKWTILNGLNKYVLPTYQKNEETVEHTGEIKVTISFNGNKSPDKNDDNEDWLN